ncbi:M20/M25/M40 family metallo-hydrolase [Sphingomonas naphthae]|uniref:M20/M25/M40 family metallo-hydrolase n=1 Tax=Sphingomonas naphthae TaxID=1813468 RepID=A0ABY7TL78_9SPHN|nr:M20/M25/M40 family metallo-hydrolase [Sphingomonas naphthae]WCT73997.1 M20/M25/M40 family metallo-hydrolase [Sphingomonas naphthae]
MRPLLGLLLATLSMPALAALSPAETKIAKAVDADADTAITLLEQLVNVNSGSLNLKGVTQVGTMMRGQLEPLGFTVTWVPMAETGRAGHIVARHKGRGRKMLLIGHLDTVFEPDSAFQKFVRTGDIAVGPGVNDDKGGMVVMVTALKAMQAAGTLKGADITIVLTGDEERTGAPLDKARADLVAAGKWADVALDFEGLAREDGKDMGSIARRSSTSWVLTTTGRAAHSSGVGESAGYGANYELIRILDSFRRELPETDLTYNVGVMAGGSVQSHDAGGVALTASGKTNVIASAAEARGDLRAISVEQQARVKAKMEAIVAQHLKGTGAKLEFNPDGYPAMAPTDGNRALLAKLNGINADLGLPEMAPLAPVKRGAGDIGFVAEDTDGLVGLGTAGKGDHAEGESVDLKSLPVQAKRAAILMTRLSLEKGRK